MKTKLTYSQKIDKIIELIKSHNVEFNVRLTNDSQDQNNQAVGLVLPQTVAPSGDFLDVALKLEDMIDEFNSIDIIYDNNQKILWHIDDDKCDPEITDKNFNQFLNFLGIKKSKKC